MIIAEISTADNQINFSWDEKTEWPFLLGRI